MELYCQIYERTREGTNEYRVKFSEFFKDFVEHDLFRGTDLYLDLS